MNKIKIIILCTVSLLLFNYGLFSFLQIRLNTEVSVFEDELDQSSIFVNQDLNIIENLKDNLETLFINDETELPDLFSYFEKTIVANNIVLNDYRIIEKKGYEEITVSVEGHIDNLVSLMKTLRFSKKPILIENLEIIKVGDLFKMSGHISYNMLSNIEVLNLNKVSSDLTFDDIARRISLYSSVTKDNYDNIFNLYPIITEPLEPEIEPNTVRLSRMPNWMVFMGKERSKDNGSDTFYILDNRTERVRQLIPDVPLGNWILSKKEDIWTIQINEDLYRMEY